MTAAGFLACLAFAVRGAAAAGATADTPLIAAGAQWDLLEGTVRVAAGAGRPPFGTAVCVGTRGGDNYLLTAEHVVPRGEARTFEAFTRSSYPAAAAIRFDGEVVFRLPESDLALVKVSPAIEGLRVVPLADVTERPRRFPAAALALGCTGGEPPAARTVRLVGRQLVRRPAGNAVFWVAAESPLGGMSGGPLLDPAGRLLGICSAVQGREGFYAHTDEILAALKRQGFSWLTERPRTAAAGE